MPPTSTALMNNSSVANGLTLEDAYHAFDLRESYLQRHASPLGKESIQTDLKINDFSTSTKNMWRSDDLELFPDYKPSNFGQDTVNENVYQAKVSSNF